MASSEPTHLDPSKLGTREYWENLYTNELSNHAANPSDEGTVWFDDSDAEARVLSFLDAITESASFDHETRREDAAFLDLGCGNGSLLFALRDDGWRGRMLGVDYSRRSVELALQIAKARKENPRSGSDDDSDDDDDEDVAHEQDLEGGERSDNNHVQTEGAGGDENEDAKQVEFSEWDVLNGDYATTLNGSQAAGWDVVLDKGTFDAICLSSETNASGRRICEGYRPRALRLVKDGGLFLITSCNWTEDELRSWFESPSDGAHTTAAQEQGRFVLVDRVAYPSFQFGGAKGQAISTLCFRKEA